MLKFSSLVDICDHYKRKTISIIFLLFVDCTGWERCVFLMTHCCLLSDASDTNASTAHRHAPILCGIPRSSLPASILYGGVSLSSTPIYCSSTIIQTNHTPTLPLLPYCHIIILRLYQYSPLWFGNNFFSYLAHLACIVEIKMMKCNSWPAGLIKK